MTPLLVMLGAGTGAATRYLAGHLLDARFPRGTLLVNVVGSFLLGWLAGRGVTDTAWSLLGVGFCGGLTTYSAFAVRTVDLARESWLRSTTYVVATLALSLAAGFVGYAIS